MITFQNKVVLNENPDIPEVNKITDDNINDLKAGINTNETNLNTLNTKVTNIAGQILWTNPNPTGDFPSQTITLNSDDFDVYEVFYYISTESLQMESCKSLKGHGTRLTIPSTNMEFRRMNAVNDTTYSFEVPSNVKFGVPVRIIGYKTGLFN